MILRVVHSTTYSYGEAVSVCHTEARLAPRSERGQTLLDHQLVIEPMPGSSIARKDYFGNAVTTFTIDEPHEKLHVTAQSLVETRNEQAIHPALTPPWEHVRATVRRHDNDETFDAYQFVFESPRVTPAAEFAAYAKPSFPDGRPLLECTLDLCHRIKADFKYDSEATTVTTSVVEAFHAREGVCQDFAHVMIACLRSLSLPARYISGYLCIDGNGIGGQASHAWLSIYCPGFGWLDMDPTNDVIPGAGYVTLGWGRDYSDVPPLKGVALGGAEQIIAVDVRVTPNGSRSDLD
jgi:transglutaminase-like putative cysteine protease